jgi:putative peptide zinc metalloprotease protein
MASPRLEKELEVTLARLALTEQRIARRLGDAKDFSQSLSLDKDRLSLIERRDALRKDIDALSLRAAVDGVVADLDPDLHAGRLLSRQDEIGLIVQGRDTVIRGYAGQEDLWRIRAGASARFIPDDAGAAEIVANVAAIAPAASAAIDIPYLAETHGGQVRVHPPQPRQETLAPVDAVHLVTIKPQEGGAGFVRVARGLVVVEGVRQSAIASIWRRSLKVLVEEMGV